MSIIIIITTQRTLPDLYWPIDFKKTLFWRVEKFGINWIDNKMNRFESPIDERILILVLREASVNHPQLWYSGFIFV